MGAASHDYPANDDQWLKAAGFNPDEYPGQETLLDYFTRKTGLESPDDYPSDEAGAVWQAIDYDGWMGVTRYYSLEERFKSFDMEIVSDVKEEEEDYHYISYSPRVITLSNGVILKEIRDIEAEDALLEEDPEYLKYYRYKPEYSYEDGYDFVFIYKVKRDDKGTTTA